MTEKHTSTIILQGAGESVPVSVRPTPMLTLFGEDWQGGRAAHIDPLLRWTVLQDRLTRCLTGPI